MRVSDIIAEVTEVTGSCSEAVNFRAITRAIELLANSGLFDPLIGTLDFMVNGDYYVALPRDVKTPIRLNIENNPAFARNRIYEFSPNTPGTQNGAEIGWQWHERGYVVIQDRTKLPGQVQYVVDAADATKTITITGIDANNRDISDTLFGDVIGSAVASTNTYKEIRTVLRDATTKDGQLYVGANAIARYYPDETEPEYRLIKLSKTGVAVRMLYRKHVFQITSLNDIIPLHSASAVIQATNAVRLLQQKKYEESASAMAVATGMIGQEQSTRDEGESISGKLELQTARNQNINANGVLIVADIFDMAAETFGSIGTEKVFDRITDSINVLSNKSNWDSLLGSVDVFRSNNYIDPAVKPERQSSYFVMPRYVAAVISLNIHRRPTIPRNRWFEFHLNGPGNECHASCHAWDDRGDTPIINPLPKEKNGRTIASMVIARPDSALDDDVAVMIYGLERLSDGREVEVYRDGSPGWLCPCKALLTYVIPSGWPMFTRIDRITKGVSGGFIKLFTLTGVDTLTASDGQAYNPSLVPIGGSFPLAVTPTPNPLGPSVLPFVLYGRYLRSASLTAYYLFADADRNTPLQTFTSPLSEDAIVYDYTFTSGQHFVAQVSGFGAWDSVDELIDFTLTRNYVYPATSEAPASIDYGELLGYWYPEEIEPRYRLIRVAGRCDLIRVRYRKRSNKITSMHDVINLSSRLALENMMRGIANQATNPQAALIYEQAAAGYLSEEQMAMNPIQGGSLQFDSTTCPGVTHNIQ